MNFLALGDSYTIGEAVSSADRWPAQLARALRAEGFDLAEPQIIARTGWTTFELDDAIDAAAPRGPFDLVSLLAGVNNQYRGQPEHDYAREFRALLIRAIAFSGERPWRVIVLSIPDWGVTPFAEGRNRKEIAAAIDRFNQINREAALEAGCPWIDVTTASRRAAHDPSLTAADGLHPSASMYAAWVELVLPVARAALVP